MVKEDNKEAFQWLPQHEEAPEEKQKGDFYCQSPGILSLGKRELQCFLSDAKE